MSPHPASTTPPGFLYATYGSLAPPAASSGWIAEFRLLLEVLFLVSWYGPHESSEGPTSSCYVCSSIA